MCCPELRGGFVDVCEGGVVGFGGDAAYFGGYCVEFNLVETGGLVDEFEGADDVEGFPAGEEDLNSQVYGKWGVGY